VFRAQVRSGLLYFVVLSKSCGLRKPKRELFKLDILIAYFFVKLLILSALGGRAVIWYLFV
jgi:hypothetical protein